MTTRELLNTLSEMDVNLTLAANGNIVIDGPCRSLTPEVIELVRPQKAALLDLLRNESAGDTPLPCPICGDSERWPTDRGPVCPTCWLEVRMPEPAPAEPVWSAERNLSPESVHAALHAFLAQDPCGDRQNLPDRGLLARFNTWLEAYGQRPTTLPTLRQAMGNAVAPPENPPAYLAVCPRCSGRNWGPSGRALADGAEVWHCTTCAAARGEEKRSQ